MPGPFCFWISKLCPVFAVPEEAKRASPWPSALSVLEAVFSIDGQRISVGKQPAFCLSQVQRDGAGLASRRQKLPQVVHMDVRLMFFRKLLQRDQRRRQRFRRCPLVVTRDPL